jgi:hypothetical protein
MINIFGKDYQPDAVYGYSPNRRKPKLSWF